MDIHPPHAIRTFKDFLVSLLTVFIGILLALGLEGLVEWQHHRALVREARENIRAEVRKNREILAGMMPEIHKRQEDLQHIIDAARQLETNPNMHTSMSYHVEARDLYSAAWQAATTSGAVTYMKYDELLRYTDLYDEQAFFLQQQEKSWRVMDELGPLIQVTMREELKKPPIGKLDAIQVEAYRCLTTAKTLDVASRDLDKAYGDLLQEK